MWLQWFIQRRVCVCWYLSLASYNHTLLFRDRSQQCLFILLDRLHPFILLNILSLRHSLNFSRFGPCRDCLLILFFALRWCRRFKRLTLGSILVLKRFSSNHIGG